MAKRTEIGGPLHVVLATDRNGVSVTRTVPSLADASRAVCEFRDRFGLTGGGATGPAFNGGAVLDASGGEVGRVSYNGKVWSAGGWRDGAAPLYVPVAA